MSGRLGAASWATVVSCAAWAQKAQASASGSAAGRTDCKRKVMTENTQEAAPPGFPAGKWGDMTALGRPGGRHWPGDVASLAGIRAGGGRSVIASPSRQRMQACVASGGVRPEPAPR
ncbi:hypothetical protein MASR1M50_07820 [Burkholderiales bacterium]